MEYDLRLLLVSLLLRSLLSLRTLGQLGGEDRRVERG